MGLLEHCFHLQRQKADVMLQLRITRRTLTSFGCPCQQHYCLQPLAKKNTQSKPHTTAFKRVRTPKDGPHCCETLRGAMGEPSQASASYPHPRNRALCCACRLSHITVHILPSVYLWLQHSVGAEGPLGLATLRRLVHTCKSKCPWAAPCPAQPCRGQR